MIDLTSSVCSSFETSSSREWLETNGIGGYATSTVSGANTRRYHGLLIAATKPPLGRVVTLSKFDETLIIDGERYDLSTNQYPGNVYPAGYKYLTGFRLDPFPRWTFEVNGIIIERSIFMVDGENTVVCRWKSKRGHEYSSKNIGLQLRPLLAFRDHHHLRHEDGGFSGEFQIGSGIIAIQPYADMPRLFFAHNAGEVEAEGHWYKNFEYAIEQERGFDYREDLFQPFSMLFDLTGDACVIASLEEKAAGEVHALETAEIERRQALIDNADCKDDMSRQLALAADQFIVKRGTGNTVIAGYPWFSDWGRDTMIALTGLTLTVNRPDIAKNIIKEFSWHISEGMLPNRFPDEGEQPEYNTVDATLWFFEAIRAYADATGDLGFIHGELYDKLVDVIEWHVLGTRYNIHVDSDGLLYAGQPDVQLTWMDAKVGDWVVTPRTGKAVEIQALWYNALCVMGQLSKKFGDLTRNTAYLDHAAIAKASFNGQFWNESEQCLFDVVNGGEKDGSVRPNQIFAVSLPYSMVSAEHARKIVDKVETELLTPVGLRSLSPKDPRYVPVYIGSPLQRDGSYHQGTVWGWLIGGYVDAYRRVHAADAKASAYVVQLLNGFALRLADGVVGQVAEIFDADAPHSPRGCGAQAWSVAELLRIIAQKQ